METAIVVAECLLIVALALCLYRVCMGPKTINRVVAVEFLPLIAIGLILLEGRRTDEGSVTIGPVLGIALISFFATTALVKLLQGRLEGEGDA